MAKKIDDVWNLYEIEGSDNVSPITINENTVKISNALTTINDVADKALRVDNLISDSNSIFMVKQWSFNVSGSARTIQETKDIGVTGYTPIGISTWGIGNGWNSQLADIAINNQLSTNHNQHTLYYAIRSDGSIDYFRPKIFYIKNNQVT